MRALGHEWMHEAQVDKPGRQPHNRIPRSVEGCLKLIRSGLTHHPVHRELSPETLATLLATIRHHRVAILEALGLKGEN
jgi:hypothetical protein